MKTFYRQCCAAFVLLVLAFSLGSVRDAHAQKGLTSAGRDFWISFMPNYLNPADNIRIFIASGTVNKVQVEVYGGTNPPTQHFSHDFQANSIWTLSLPNPALAEERIPETPEYKAIHIYSENPIAVYGFSNVYTTTDSYLAIPTAGLDTEYYPSCFYDDTYGFLSDPLAGEFVIVAPYDNTLVTIGPVRCETRSDPSGTISHQTGDKWVVNLMKGQTYLVQSTGLDIGNSDLTGTHIISTKPIGLISGHQRVRIPVDGGGNSKDHICEMMPPLSRWDTEYYDMPQAGRPGCGNYIRLIAGEDGVYITENKKGIAQLNHAGDFVDRELILDPVDYKSNGKKFMVVEHSYSANYNNDPSPNADPYSIVMTPKRQFQKKMIFRVPNNVASGGSYINYGTFICRKDSIDKIMISVNGGPPKHITSFQFAGQGDYPWDSVYTTEPQYSGYRIQFPSQTASYVATCGEPFACYIYGFSYAESYGHPAGMALNIISPDTLPPLELHDSACGNFNVQLIEHRHIPKFSFEDTRIAEFGMITDSNDLRWPHASYNYVLNPDPKHPFVVGDSTAYFSLAVLDPSQDAYAAVWVTDRAGNDTVYEYHYSAPSMQALKYPAIDTILVTNSDCRTITIKNTQKSDLVISDAFIKGVDPNKSFTLTTQAKNRILHPGDTLQLQVCFTTQDTSGGLVSVQSYHMDSLIVLTGCAPFAYPVAGVGVTPLIFAEDVDFGNVTVGDAVTKVVPVHNVGRSPLTLDKNWTLHNTTDFTFADASQLPVTIPPGGLVNLNFRFHPQQVGPVQTRQDWTSNLPEPFLHQIKDTSLLTGVGLAAALKWDRTDQGFWTECNTPAVQRVNLLNPSGTAGTGTSITVDSIVISGPDADEFTIAGSQPGYLPGSQGWPLENGTSLWVDLKFTPNIAAKGYRPRTAEIRAYGASGGKVYHPVIELAATVRHSTIRITPSSYDFGAVDQGTPLTTNVWIHNDGDTALSLTNLAIDSGFTISGFTSGEIIKAGDSVMVTLSTSAKIGITLSTITASGPVECTDTAMATARYSSSSLGVQSTGNDFGSRFICQSADTVVSTAIYGSKGAKFISARIIDTLGTNGSSQFTFDDGTQSKTLSTFVAPNGSETFTVRFTPKIGGGSNAMIVYTWLDTSKNVYVIDAKPLGGIGLHYTTTLSVQNAGNQAYTAHAKDVINLPIQMTTTMDQSAQIYGIDFTVRYKRDEFVATAPAPENGLIPSNFTTKPDPTDNTYELAHVTLNSNNPITPVTTISHLPLEYVVNKDTTSTFQVMDVAFLGKDGNTACWVSHDTIPGTFLSLDLCGDQSLRGDLNGNPISGIQEVTPNPVSGSASVQYDVRRSGIPVTMDVYDLLGHKVLSVMDNQAHAAGSHNQSFDTSSLPNGSYVLRLSAAGFVQSRQFVVQK